MTIQKRKKQAVKKRNHDKSESIRQYQKEKYLKNRASKITYQKAKNQENSEVQLALKSVNTKKIQNIQKEIKKSSIRNDKKGKKVVMRLRIFFNK